jgi:small nuclear ribonucleoprotein (snRNP)-like protein
MPSSCNITPVSAFQSTNLNSKIDSYCRLADRIVRSLGAPLISVEVHQDQIYENISIACELFTRYAGYTQEYLIFDSNLYERNKGIRLDVLFTLSNPNLTLDRKVNAETTSRSTSPYIEPPPTEYVCTSAVPASYFAQISTLSAAFTDGMFAFQLFDYSTYNAILTSFDTTFNISLSDAFRATQRTSNKLSLQGNCATESVIEYNNMFDYDVMDYRKVISVTDFEEGSTTGINTLFTIEQTLAQQTYFSYAMGNYGFDLISWYTLKNWLDTREKMLATKRDMKFDERTQYMVMYPQPNSNSRFYGVISAYVERPLRDIIKEFWVFEYALALTKISVGYVRSKYGQMPLFGGQVFSSDIMTQGIEEKRRLEEQLYTGAAPGMGAVEPVMFIVG